MAGMFTAFEAASGLAAALAAAARHSGTDDGDRVKLDDGGLL